jgi:tricorn protease
MVIRSGSRLRVCKAGGKPQDENDPSPSRKSGWIDLSRVRVPVNPGIEWRQMFREAWRLQRDHFWNAEMSGVDWLQVYDSYSPLVERVASRSEFSDLVWEMQGELGTSHCYEIGGDYRPAPAYGMGSLGADFAYDPESAAWRVAHIVQGDAWDENSGSPLAKAGLNVQVGDRLLSVNGQKLSQSLSPGVALVDQPGREVTLVFSRDGEEKPRPVTVRTLPSDTPARYREWVEKNRRYVHAATGGKVGYIHIPDMGPSGYSEFHRGFLAEIDRPGLIVDLRYNSGGEVSPLLLEKLARKRIGYDKSRWDKVLHPYPPESVLGPMVALTNEWAGSDGDIFSHGFKMMKLGPLLGKRTWGGVIGFWPRQHLVDGALITQPESSFWFKDAGWGVENYGVDPDIEVDNTPQDDVRGVDAQLDRSIEEVLKLMAANPPELPQLEQVPSRAMPKLPQRG